MKLADIGDIQELVADNGIEDLKLFQADVETISELGMQVLIKQIRMKLGLRDGHIVARQLLDELRKAAALGLIPSCPAARHKLELPRMTMD